MATTDTVQAEYEALTERCGLIDRSARGKLALTGADAVEFLNGQVTNELADLRPGEGRYAAFLTHKGKMLGDLRILAVDAGAASAEPGSRQPAETGMLAGGGGPPAAVAELLLDTERVALQALFDMVRHYKLGYDVELHKRTLECGLLSLVGPHHAAVAWAAVDRPVGGPPASGPPASGPPASDRPAAAPTAEHAHVPAAIGGAPVRLIATADGTDVLCTAPDLETVRAALVEAGATLASETAAEIVRVEHGCPRYGVDIDEHTIPQEAGLNERAVSFTKGCYVGQETVARLYYRGKPNRHLRGLRFAPPGETLASLPAHGEELRLGERPVGHVGSVVASPRLGTIGLALVRREATPGDTLAVGEQGAGAEVVELPFAA